MTINTNLYVQEVQTVVCFKKINLTKYLYIDTKTGGGKLWAPPLLRYKN